jgi:hypothetical protein
VRRKSSPGHEILSAKLRGFAFMSVPSKLGKANECKNLSTIGRDSADTDHLNPEHIAGGTVGFIC